MKQWIICTSLLLMYTLSYTQTASIKQFTQLDGLKVSEVTEALLTHDSLWWIWEGDRTISKFNRYSFQNEEPDFNAYILYNKVIGKDFTLIRSSEEMLYYQDQKFTSLMPLLYDIYGNNGNVLGHRNDSIFTFSQQNLTFDYITDIKKLKITYPCIAEEDTITRYYHFTDDDDYYLTLDALVRVKKSTKQCQRVKNPYLTSHLHGISSLISMNQILRSKAEDTIKTSSFYINSSHLNLLNITPNSIEDLGIHKTDQSFSYESFEDLTIVKPSHEGLELFNPNVRFFSNENPEMARALHTITEDAQGNIWFGDYRGGWSKWDNKEVKKMSKVHRILPGAINIDGIIYYTFDNFEGKSFGKIQNGRISTITDGLQPISGYMIKEFSDGHIFSLSNKHGAVLFKKENFPISPLKELKPETGLRFKYALCADQDLSGRFWLSKDGLAVYDVGQDSLACWTKADSLDNYFGSITISCDSMGSLWGGSTKGLYHIPDIHEIDITDKNVFDHATLVPLPNSTNHRIFGMTQVDSFLVIGGISHISFLSLPSFYRDPSNPIIYQLIFGEDIQGGGAEQNCFLMDSKRRFWIGCQEGAIMIDWDHFKFDQTKNEIQLERIKIGNSILKNQHISEIIIPTDNRNMEVHFGPKKNPSLLKNIFFEYAFINDSGDTISYKNRDQNGVYKIDYIPPDKYKLNIKASKHGVIMDEVNIDVKAPYALLENPIFWALTGGFALLILASFYQLRSKNKDRIYRKDLKLSLANQSLQKTRLQAIIASFNPHFINNSLHWAQSRYSRDKVLTVLIGRLSENIQYIFQQTRKGKALHNLSDELRLVDNYIEIQKIRFSDEFEYHPPRHIHGFENLKVPIMQLQIHVENAIEHGLSNQELSGYVKVSIEDDGRHLRIIIEDDGCGRVMARSIGSQGTQSGTKMLNEVHEILNSINEEEISTEYIDNHLGQHGTKVIIKIPKTLIE